MRSAAPSQNGAWLARIASVVTLLALIVAPACSSLCAAGACMGGPVSAGMDSDCHFGGSAHGGAVDLHSVHGCGTPELQLADLTSTSRGESFQKDRTTASADGFGVASDEHSIQLADLRGTFILDLEGPPYFGSSTARVVLRI